MKLKLELFGDSAFDDVIDEIEAQGRLTRIAVLKGGMRSGKSSIALLITLDSGKRIIGQTSLELFLEAAKTIVASPLIDAKEPWRN
jgi:chloramphenicol 3-O-phosphotransferase